MNKIKKILSIFYFIFDLLLILIMISVFYNFVQISVLDKLYCNFFGYTIFDVKTGSMADTININDCVIVKITDDVALEDIISYQEDNSIITHRIVEIKNDKYVTRGDANSGNDRPIDKKKIIGKVVKIVPNLGIWIKVFSDIKVIIPIVITITFLGFTIFTKEKKESKRRRKRRKALENEGKKEKEI